MPATSTIIMSNQTHPGDSTSTTVTGEKFQGDGYYGRSDGFHTVQMNVNGVAGTIQIQGTLATTPADADYFNIAGALYDSTTAGKDGSFVFNFTGNFTYIRATVEFDSTDTNGDGSVSKVLYNF